MNKLRKVFMPTPREEIEQLENILNNFCLEDRLCNTCIHYVPTSAYTPGFVTDFGDCKEGFNVCEFIHEGCLFYQYNSAPADMLKNRIDELKSFEKIYRGGHQCQRIKLKD